MRIATMIAAGSVVVLVILAGPARAKHGASREAEAKSASSSCHAYEPAVDGRWTELLCQEIGSQTQHRPPSNSQEEQPR